MTEKQEERLWPLRIAGKAGAFYNKKYNSSGRKAKAMRKKWILTLLLEAALLLVLAACGQRVELQSTSAALGDYYGARHTVLPCDAEMYCAAIGTDGAVYYVTDLLAGEDTEECALFRLPPEGKAAPLEAFFALKEELRRQAAELWAVEAMTAGEDGTLLLGVRLSCRKETAQGETEEWLEMRLLLVDENGALLAQTTLPEEFLLNSDTQLVRNAAGQTVVSDTCMLLTLDPACGLIRREDRPVTYLSLTADGGVAALSEAPGGESWEVRLVEPATGALSAPQTLPAMQEGAIWQCRFYPGAGGYDLLCAADLSLYGCRLGGEGQSGEGRLLLSWLNCDVEGSGLKALRAVGERDYACVSYSSALGADSAVLTWQETDPAAGQTLLTMACREMPATVGRMILKYNRSSPNTRIVVQDYGVLQDGGVDRLTVDLSAGRLPDLFCTAGIDLQPLIDKDYLEDLWPYIDGDAQLGREALVQPLFDAMSVRDRLYAVTDGFTLETALALPKLVGEEPGWTLAEFRRAYEGMEHRRSLAGRANREAVLEDIIALYAQSFIDWQKGKASFDSAAFAELLEYAALYPAEQVSYAETRTWLAEGEQLFLRRQIWAPGQAASNTCSSFGGQAVTWIGLPGLGGSGSAFHPSTPLAMSAACKEKDAAWSFLRMLLLPEHQDYYSYWKRGAGGSYFMPTNQMVFDDMLREAMQAPEGRHYRVGGPYGDMIEVQPWTQEQADAFRRLLEETTVVYRQESAIEGILRDEIGRFFAGQQDAETAAAAIQDRVMLCIRERN